MAKPGFLMGMFAIGALLWVGTPYAHSQKTTEMFIPLGQSPGLSGKVTVIGTIEAVDAQNQTIVVAGSSEKWSAEVTKSTHIWLDRSKLGLSSQHGTFTDLREGR